MIRNVNLRFRERARTIEGERAPKSLRGIVRALLPRHAPTFFLVACPLSSESGVVGGSEEKSKTIVRRKGVPCEGASASFYG